jgi:hypothetical protein
MSMSNVPIYYLFIFVMGQLKWLLVKIFLKKIEVWSCFVVLKRKCVNVHQ